MLGVFGDSFSDSSEYPLTGIVTPSWPVQVAKRLNLNLENFSYSGTSMWYSFRNFKKNFKKFTHIIFVYTEENRWSSLPDNLKRFSSIYTKEKLDVFPTISKSEYKIMEQLIEVHPLLFDEMFNHYLSKLIFTNVNDICKEHGIKLINIFPFIDSKKDKINLIGRYGASLINLLTVSEHEMYTPSLINGVQLNHEEFSFFVDNGDYRRNHINPINNMIMTDILVEQFIKNKPNVIDLFKEKDFNYDIETLLEYKRKLESVLNVRK